MGAEDGSLLADHQTLVRIAGVRDAISQQSCILSHSILFCAVGSHGLQVVVERVLQDPQTARLRHIYVLLTLHCHVYGVAFVADGGMDGRR